METLIKKLEEVRKKKEQLIANYNALCGAEGVLVELIKEGESNEQNSDD